jgi:uncharacterized membrane protein YeaQ/YmgE (transglycosylase-associated protein family)
MDVPLSVMGTPGLSLITLILIGGFAGWIAGMIRGTPQGLLTNILVGVAGSWVGSELANVAGVVVRHTFGHLIAAIIGSLLVLYVWQMLRDKGVQRY